MKHYLSQLIADLEAATGASFDLDCRIADALEPERLAGGMQPAPYTASLDAVTGLAGRKFPDRDWVIAKGGTAILAHDTKRLLTVHVKSATPAIALCICILKAKQREWMR